MAAVIKPPQSLDGVTGISVFLAGTIDEGKSVDWQQIVTAEISTLDITILNPRRAEWDTSWMQSIENPNFREQVEWELRALELATYVFLYFAAGSSSPISLLELGLHARSGKVIIVCPEGYWKKGNVDIVANRYGLAVFEDLSLGLNHLKASLLQPNH